MGGIPPIARLLRVPIPFVQEQAVTLVANLAMLGGILSFISFLPNYNFFFCLLESNLEDLRNAGVIPLLVALLNSSDAVKVKAVWAVANLVVNGINDKNKT